MQHLDSTRLAAFDHERFTVEELAHLTGCAVCRAEREGVQQLVTRAGEAFPLDAMAEAPRLVSWERLAVELRREGLLTSGEPADDVQAGLAGGATVQPLRPAVGEVPASSRRWFVQARRAVAALALVASGAAMGRLSRAGGEALPVAEAGAALRSVGFGDRGFASVEQATDVLNRAQRDYERASLWLAANDSTVRDSDVYRARLAALDQMMAASRAALREAPQDPVLNHYYLAAYTAREATLQQLGGTLPVDKVIERY
jgi:hypothetical protein